MRSGQSSHEESFFERLELATGANERMAGAAVELIEAGEAVFVDSSTTGYFLSQRSCARTSSARC